MSTVIEWKHRKMKGLLKEMFLKSQKPLLTPCYHYFFSRCSLLSHLVSEGRDNVTGQDFYNSTFGKLQLNQIFFFFPFSFHPPPITSPQEVQPMKCMECLYVYLYQITFIAEAADVTCPRFYIKFISKQGQFLVGSSSVLSSVLLWFLSPQICKGYQQWEKIVRLSVLLLEVTALLFSFSPVPFPDRSTG